MGHWNPAGLTARFGGCDRRATIGNAAGIENEDLGTAVWVCPQLPDRWSEIWDEIRALG